MCLYDFHCAFNCGTLSFEICSNFLLFFLSVSLLYVSIYGAKIKTSPEIVCWFFLFYCQLNMTCLSSNSACQKKQSATTAGH